MEASSINDNEDAEILLMRQMDVKFSMPDVGL